MGVIAAFGPSFFNAKCPMHDEINIYGTIDVRAKKLSQYKVLLNMYFLKSVGV